MALTPRIGRIWGIETGMEQLSLPRYTLRDEGDFLRLQ
jgi:hypothetical protein